MVTEPKDPHWEELQPQIRQRWDVLGETEIDQLHLGRDELVDLLQARCQLTEQEAKTEVDLFYIAWS